MSCVKQVAIDKEFDIEGILNFDIESSGFEYDFEQKGKPLCLLDTLDGQKSFGRFQSQRKVFRIKNLYYLYLSEFSR